MDEWRYVCTSAFMPVYKSGNVWTGCNVEIAFGCLGPCAPQLGCCPGSLLGSHEP